MDYLNLINHEPDIDKIYLCSKDPNEAKYQWLIKRWKIFIKILKNTIQIKSGKY